MQGRWAEGVGYDLRADILDMVHELSSVRWTVGQQRLPSPIADQYTRPGSGLTGMVLFPPVA